MPAERYFSDQQFQDDMTIAFTDQEFHHLVHVMRTRIEESIEIINGRGQLATGKVTSIEKKSATITIEKVLFTPPPSQQIILAQAIPRMNRLEFILEKGTELGMTDIWLFPSIRSEKRAFTESQMLRMQGILVAATKQCGRLYLPKISLKPTIKEWDAVPHPAYYGDVSPIAPSLLSFCQKQSGTESVLICIGPESGFTEEEHNQLQVQGCTGIKLHFNILRTDTAAICALSLLTGCK